MIQEYYVRGRGGDGRLPAGQWAFVCLWHRALYWMMMIEFLSIMMEDLDPSTI